MLKYAQIKNYESHNFLMRLNFLMRFHCLKVNWISIQKNKINRNNAPLNKYRNEQYKLKSKNWFMRI